VSFSAMAAVALAVISTMDTLLNVIALSICESLSINVSKAWIYRGAVVFAMVIALFGAYTSFELLVIFSKASGLLLLFAPLVVVIALGREEDTRILTRLIVWIFPIQVCVSLVGDFIYSSIGALLVVVIYCITRLRGKFTMLDRA